MRSTIGFAGRRLQLGRIELVVLDGDGDLGVLLRQTRVATTHTTRQQSQAAPSQQRRGHNTARQSMPSSVSSNLFLCAREWACEQPVVLRISVN